MQVGWGWCCGWLLVFLALAQLAGMGRLLDGEVTGVVAWARLILSGVAALLLLVGVRGLLPSMGTLRFGAAVLIALTLASVLGTLFPSGTPESGVDPDGFVQAEAHFIWSLTHPGARLSSPPSDEAGALRWLQEQGVAKPAATTGQHLLGPDLEAQGMIFGPEERRRTWKRSRRQLVEAAAQERTVAHLRRHARVYSGFYELADWLQLTRLWRSGWFAGLVGLLFVSVALATFRRRRPGLAALGFWCAHGGILVVIIGATVSRLFEERSMVHLQVGRVEDRQVPLGGAQRVRPINGRLAVELVDFKAVPHYTLNLGVKVGLDDALARSLPQGRLRDMYFYRQRGLTPGRVLPLLATGDRDPRWRVTIEEILPRVRSRVLWEPASAAAESPVKAALFTPLEEEDPDPLALTSAGGEPGVVHLDGGWRLALLPGLDAAALRRWEAGEELDRYGALEVRIKGGKWQRIPLREGGRVTLQDEAGPIKVQIWRVMQRFSLEAWGGTAGIYGKRLQAGGEREKVPNSLERNRVMEPDNPAAALVLEGPEGVARHYAFAGGRQGHGAMGAGPYKQVEARLDWDRLRCPAAGMVVLARGPQGLRLIRAEGGKVVEARALEPGATLDLGGRKVRYDRFLERADYRLEVTPLTEGDPLFHDDPSALKVRVDGPAGTKRMTLVATSQTRAATGRPSRWATGWYDSNLALHYEEMWEMPVEWFSKLRAWRIDAPRARTADGRTLVVDLVDAARWQKLLAELREIGAPTASLTAGNPFADTATRRARLTELDAALDKVLGTQPAAFWQEKLSPGLVHTLEAWVAARRAVLVGEQRVRVNEPLRLARPGFPAWLGRYQFSQSNAAGEHPDYSGLGLVWDPGFGLARLGMLLIVLGGFIAFLALPLRRDREGEGGADGGGRPATGEVAS